MYEADAGNDKKQQPKQLTFQNPSFVPVFATNTLAQVTNPSKGTMTYSLAGNRLYVYDGSEWKYAALS